MPRRTGAVGLVLVAMAAVGVAGTFTVEGRKLYLECHETGSPTIVL